MLQHPTLEKLRQLKLTGMAQGLKNNSHRRSISRWDSKSAWGSWWTWRKAIGRIAASSAG